MRRFLFFVLLALFLPLGVAARETGSGHETAVVQGVSFSVFTYRPPGCARPALLFVFHGKNRNAADYRDYARPFADRVCLVVLAPLFDRDRFRNWRYQRGGIVRKRRVQPRARWTVALVAGLVDWARRREGRPDAPYYLFGHSAGGQFLSRVAAFAAPRGASRIVIANPSTYVLPSLEEPAPYGMGGVFDDRTAETELKAYLSLPVTIYLAAKDTGTKNLVRNAAARRQGKHRLDRGKKTFRAAEILAKARGWAFNWKLVVAPGVGHSSRRMLASSRAIEAFGLSSRNAGP